MGSDGVSGYAAVNTRVRALYSEMLAPAAWDRLCDAADFDALISALKETAYGPHLTLMGERVLTPRRAVFQMKGLLADAFTTVVRLMPKASLPLLTQVYRLFEVDNLKAVLRGIVAGASWDEVRFVLFPMGSFTVLPAQEMVEAGDVGAAVELLRGTPYYGTLSHAMERYVAESSLFPLEVALDLDYRRELWADVQRLQGQDRAHALHVVGAQVDMDNLMWAIRYRVYHHLSEEEIINYTVPFGYEVRDEDIRAIAAGNDIASVVSHVYPDLGEVRPLLEEPRAGLPELELRLQRRVVAACRGEFIGYPFHVGIPLAYGALVQFEIQDLTVLVEAKSLRIAVEELRRHLVIGCQAQV